MPFRFNEIDNSIKMACGDTGDLFVEIETEGFILTPCDVILFAIFDNSTGEDLMCKHAEIENGQAHIRLCNYDTRDIPAGLYKWNLRIVTDPIYDEDGNVRVDECTDDVITVFDSPPTIRLTRGGARV